MLKFSKYIFSKKKIFVKKYKNYFEIFYFAMESSILGFPNVSRGRR
jgi:hypothetical protein